MEVEQDQDKLNVIIERLESISTIPTIPLVATRAMAAARDPDSSMRDIAEIISTDPPLAARVLKLVNSAYYSLRQSVGSLPLALTILGIREITNLVMSISVMTMFPDSARGGLFDRQQFWRHSAAAGQVGKVLAERLGFQRLGSEAFVGGLLHDIGRIIMDEYLHREFCEAIELSAEEDLSPCDAESIMVGATHPQVGAWLTKKWKLPDDLITAISCHHSPERIESEAAMKQIVYAANTFCLAFERGCDGDDIAQTMQNDPVWKSYLLNAKRHTDIGSLVGSLLKEVERTSSLVVV